MKPARGLPPVGWSLGLKPEKQRDEDVELLRTKLGPWTDRIRVVCPVAIDLAVWWYDQPTAHPPPAPPPPAEPSPAERAASIRADLENLRGQLKERGPS